MPFLKEPKMYMKINILYKWVKIKQIKHSALLLIRFYQVQNTKPITLFNSIGNDLGWMDIPLTDSKVGCYDRQGLI